MHLKWSTVIASKPVFYFCNLFFTEQIRVIPLKCKHDHSYVSTIQWIPIILKIVNPNPNPNP